jgi:hypothetical protein
MEDKDFLDYFNRLGPPFTLDDTKLAASKIIASILS